MLLNNFKKFLAISTQKSLGFTNTSFAGARKDIPDNPTSQWDYVNNNTKYISGSYGSSNVGIGLVIGSGTTPPELTDYKLENEVTSGFTENTGSVTFGSDKIILSMTITATSAITINEVGIRAVMSAISLSSTRDQSSVLLTRSIISEPAVLNSGDTKTFTVEIDYNTFVDNVNNL